MVELFANSGDPDQMSHSVADLGVHCLPVTCLGVSSLQWVKSIRLNRCTSCSESLLGAL